MGCANVAVGNARVSKDGAGRKALAVSLDDGSLDVATNPRIRAAAYPLR